MLGYSYKYIVVVSDEYCSDDESYEIVHSFNNIDDALKFMDSVDQSNGIGISLYEHKYGAWF